MIYDISNTHDSNGSDTDDGELFEPVFLGVFLFLFGLRCVQRPRSEDLVELALRVLLQDLNGPVHKADEVRVVPSLRGEFLDEFCEFYKIIIINNVELKRNIKKYIT